MKTRSKTLNVVSSGVVCPGGATVESLEQPWTKTNIQNASGTRFFTASPSDPAGDELQKWLGKPRLRRASTLSLMLIEAVHQALRDQPVEILEHTGVVACFFLGCLNYPIRFYREITTDGRRFASPVLFPETVFNSPISHVVSTLGIGGPVYSQIGDKSAWASALQTAECWLRNGSAKKVVVVGAEEFDPHALDAFRAAGWMRSKDFHPGSGAGALLVDLADESKTAITRISQGHSFFHKKEVSQKAREGLETLDRGCPVLQTATAWTTRIESEVLAHRELVPNPNRGVECFSASTAWDTIRAVNLLKRGGGAGNLVVPIWGLTSEFAALQLSSVS
jgi:hypothetical protein